MSGEGSGSLIVRVSVWFASNEHRGATGHFFKRLAEPFQIDVSLLKGLGFTSQLNASPNPRGKEQNARDEQTNGESCKDRLIDRRRGFKQPEEIAKRDFLFLILQEEGQAQQQKGTHQNQPDHSLALPFLTTVRCRAVVCLGRPAR